jgi:hypothetical protein
VFSGKLRGMPNFHLAEFSFGRIFIWDNAYFIRFVSRFNRSATGNSESVKRSCQRGQRGLGMTKKDLGMPTNRLKPMA